MILELPYPPSVNGYWRSFRGRQIISEKGREYRERVVSELLYQRVQQATGRLRVSMILYPPDKRRRDLDNFCKASLDALAHGGAYVDDSQIDELMVKRGPLRKGGAMLVQIENIDQPTDQLTKELNDARETKHVT